MSMQVTKVWWDGEKLMAEPIPESEIYKESAQQEPVALPCCGYTDASAVKWNPYNQVLQCHNCGQVYTSPPAQQEPVAIIASLMPAERHTLLEEGHSLHDSLYTSPPASKPLTDEEIDTLREKHSEGRGSGWRFDFKGFARAIEAKLKEKNT